MPVSGGGAARREPVNDNTPSRNPRTRRATNMKMSVLIMPGQSSDWGPTLASAAPIIPPISAWESGDLGIQVNRSQAHAPTSVPKITALGVCTMRMSMMPFPMVRQRRPKKRKAMKLKKAAHRTRGERTRVDVELAESWKPFRKSNVSASAIRKRMVNVVAQACLTRMDSPTTSATSSQTSRTVRLFVDLFALDDGDRVLLRLEKLSETVSAHRVAHVLEATIRRTKAGWLSRILHVPQAPDGRHGADGLLDDRSAIPQVLIHAGELVHIQPPDDRERRVRDIVEFLRQGVDIFAVERRANVLFKRSMISCEASSPGARYRASSRGNPRSRGLFRQFP